MKNLIYQVWAGEMRPACKYSVKLLKEYADRIGVEYKLDVNPNTASKYVAGDDSKYFEWLNPIVDNSFLDYDNVCVLDLDVFPVNNLNESIFEQPIVNFGVCTEPFQGRYRESTRIRGGISKSNDERWALEVKKQYGSIMPRDNNGHLKVYNAGVVIFTKEGMKLAREKFIPYQQYIDTMTKAGLNRFYTVDQNYFHAMMVTSGDYTEIDNGWNSYIHSVTGPLALQDSINDSRNKSTKLVHIQLSGVDYFEDQKIDRIVNLPRSKWNI